MSAWQAIATAKSGESLGDTAAVTETLSSLFPGLSLSWSPSGSEKLAQYDRDGLAIPDVLREVLEHQPSFLCGSTSHRGASVSFNLGSADHVEAIWIAVEGTDSDVEAARQLLESLEQWSVVPEHLDVSFEPPGAPAKGATLFRRKV